MTLGELNLIKLIATYDNCFAKMQNGLMPMHCAAQTYAGMLSLLYMHQVLGVDVNQVDHK